MRVVTGVDVARVDRFLRETQYLYLDLPERGDPRRDYGATVDWWWATQQRAVIALSGGVLTVTRPASTDKPGLTFRDCERVALIGLQHGPQPGGVEVGRNVTVTLARHGARPRREKGTVPAVDRREPALERHVGEEVTLVADGEDERREWQGVVAASAVLRYQVVLCLTDGTCAVVHQPADVREEDGAVVVTGQPQRVVVDERPDRPGSQTRVIRPGRLLLRPGL